MDIENVKCSFLCYGCLSNDRKLAPLGEFLEIYQSLIGDQKQFLSHSTSDVNMCWECVASLKKFKMFQTQIITAQETLMQFMYGIVLLPEPLSKLTTTLKTDYDYKLKQEITKRKRKTTEVDDDNNPLKNTEIKIEFTSNDSIEADIGMINHENDMKTDDVNQANDSNEPCDFFTNDMGNNFLEMKAEDDDFSDHDEDFSPVLNEVPIKSEENESKTKKDKKNTDKWRYYKFYAEHSTLVETKQIDWGNINSHFNILHFDEKELEKYIFIRERLYADYKRYKYFCQTCELGYRSVLDLQRHNDINHRKPNSPFKCSSCKKTVKSLSELEDHWRTHTPIAKCTLCDLVLRPRGMKQHLNLAHTKQYACKYCRKTFGTLSSFGAHYRDNHMKYTCDYCNLNFKSKSRIAYHIKNIHVPAFCVECNRPYRNRNQYMKHCVLMHPQLTKRKQIPNELCFCVECNKQFKSLAQYRKHLKVSVKHVKPKIQRVACPECDKIFARKLYMKNHYSLYHLKKTNNYCELCDKYFARAFGLRMHNTHVHQKVQKVRDKICDLCGRAFSSNRIMLNHRRTHTGERPHKCSYCTAEFIQKYAMQTHMRTQHKHFA